MPKKNKRIIIAITVAICAILLLLLLWFLLHGTNASDKIPTLIIETPPKQSISQNESFTVDVRITDLGDELYPAFSLSLVFDSVHLEFLGVEEGNVTILDDINADGSSIQLPEWSVDVERSNDIGKINVMYLDMTGGKYAFTKDFASEEKNILMKLSFRLRGSASVGDIYELDIADAVFAASDENNSLASISGTLKIQNGKIIVGE